MDTRSKILSGPEAVPDGPWALVTGYFDVLGVEQVRELLQVRQRAQNGGLLVVVVRGTEPLLPLRGRAEMVAALRMVDYVLTADDGDVDGLVETLRPAFLARLESEDLGRLRRLKEHVHRRQG